MKSFTRRLRAGALAFTGLLTAVGAYAQSRVELSFIRVGTTADDVAILLQDETGATIAGAKATLTLSQALKATAEKVNCGVLCLNMNATGSGERTYQLDITGLPTTFSYDRVRLETRALNGQSKYQDAGQVRQWNLTLEQGATADALTTFGTLTDYDLNQAQPSLPTFEGTATTTSEGTLSLKLTADKGTSNGGCFIGLTRIVLYTEGDATLPAEYEQDDDATAFVVDLNNGSFTATNPAGTYAKTWTATATDPGLTLAVANNDMAATGTNLALYYTGTSGGNYTLQTDAGYVVSAYAIEFSNASSANMSFKPAFGQTVTCTGTDATAYASAASLTGTAARFKVTSSSGGTAAMNTAKFFVKVKQGGTEDAKELFTTNSGGTPYRIPAIAKTHNGSLLAISDYRPGRSDIGYGEVDIVARISTDNGATWGEQFTIADGTGTKGQFDTGFGDAAVVADRESGRVLIMAAAGNVGYQYSTRQNPIPVARMYSEDNGQTWSTTPEDVTQSIYGLFDGSALGNVDALFFGSGRICQSSLVKVGEYYRLYAALCARPGGNRVVYSDDFGATWHVLGGDINTSPAPDGDEPKCEELPDGSVVLSSRKNGGRYYNIFSYTDVANAQGFWGDVVASESCTDGVVATSNSTNGEILIVPAVRNADQTPVYIALQSVPLGSGRANVGLYWKELATDADLNSPTAFATGWDGVHQSSCMNSAYSTMTMQADGKLAFLYEESTHSADYTIIYKQYTLEGLTGGAYSYAPTTADAAAFMQAADPSGRIDNVTFGKYVGMPDEAKKSTVQAALSTFASTGTVADCAAYNKAVQDNRVVLTEGKWYRIRNVGRANGTLSIIPREDYTSFTTHTIENADNATTATEIYTFEKREGGWAIKNIAMASLFLGPTQGQDEATPIVDSLSAGLFVVESTLAGRSVMYCSNAVHSSYKYLNLSTNGQNLVPWHANDVASQWYLEPIADEWADVLNAIHQPLYLAKLYYEQYASAGMTRDDDYLTDGIAQPANMVSNAAQLDEGSIANLGDSDVTTYFHTAWSPTYAPAGGGYHFLQMELDEWVTDFYLKFSDRHNNTNNTPRHLVLQAPAEGESIDDLTTAWTNVLYDDAITYDYATDFGSQGVKDNTTAIIHITTDKPVKYLRFVVTETQKSQYVSTSGPWWNLSELRVYPADNPLNDVATVDDDLAKQIAAIEAGLLNGTITLDEREVLNTILVYNFLPAYRGTFQITSADYATYYVDHAFVMPDGVTGGYVSGSARPGEEGTTFRIDDVWLYTPGTVVPAYTPIILKSSDDLSRSENFNYKKTHVAEGGETAHVPTTNLLYGNLADGLTRVDDEADGEYWYYKLCAGGPNDEVGFWWGDTQGNAFHLSANKAFMAIPRNAVGAIVVEGFNLEEGGVVNAISSPALSTEQPSAIYTLSGVRINATATDGLPAGVYIVDGKKVLVR